MESEFRSNNFIVLYHYSKKQCLCYNIIQFVPECPSSPEGCYQYLVPMRGGLCDSDVSSPIWTTGHTLTQTYFPAQGSQELLACSVLWLQVSPSHCRISLTKSAKLSLRKQGRSRSVRPLLNQFLALAVPLW